MKNVSFEVTKKERELIDAIAIRAHEMFKKAGVSYPILDIEMDITATHANGNKLRLKDLLDADDFNFSHDVGGIRWHLNRDIGQLMECFVPRFSWSSYIVNDKSITKLAHAKKLIKEERPGYSGYYCDKIKEGYSLKPCNTGRSLIPRLRKLADKVVIFKAWHMHGAYERYHFYTRRTK